MQCHAIGCNRMQAHANVPISSKQGLTEQTIASAVSQLASQLVCPKLISQVDCESVSQRQLLLLLLASEVIS